MSRTSPYPSELSDAEWALLEPLLQSSERRARTPKWPARRVADAVFYSAQKRLRLADAPQRVPALADGLLPLLEVAQRRAASAGTRAPS